MSVSLINVRENRKRRTRLKVKGRNRENRKRIIFSVSNKYLYAQLVDDANGKTLLTISSADKTLSGKSAKNKEEAVKLAENFASKAPKEVGEKFVFDRGRKLYHGKVKAFADALREKGFEF